MAATLACVTFLAVGALAQSTDAPTANPSASLEQCRNGGTAPGVDCTGSAWVTGNAGASNSHWQEQDFLPYRMLFDNLVTGADAAPGTHVYTVIIGYDIKHSGAHAIDYLGTYNSTNAGANPCSGVTGCTGWAVSTKGITADTAFVTNQVNPNLNGSCPGAACIAQVLGQQFTMWGGTLRSFAYTAADGPITASQVERQVTLTFTAQVANPVLAWSGHVGWAGDWGPGQSAGSLSGSPYHMRLIDLDGSGGNQDRSLSADAIAPSAAVLIRKEVITPDGTNTAITTFNFDATANFGPTAFTLKDLNSGVNSPGTPQGSQSITSFGAANTITVHELKSPGGTIGAPSGWTLSDINCVESGTQNSTKSGDSLTAATIIVEAFEVVTCTFRNTQSVVTAAPASISGRVTSADGIGLRNVSVTLTDANSGEVRIARTNMFGYYGFIDVQTADLYRITVSSKTYTFDNPTRWFTLTDDLADQDFISSPAWSFKQ